MIVRDLRNIVNDYNVAASDRAVKVADKAKLGYRTSQLLSDHKFTITGILAKAVLDANEPLLESDKARVPTWLTQSEFDQLIFKIKYACQSY